MLIFECYCTHLCFRFASSGSFGSSLENSWASAVSRIPFKCKFYKNKNASFCGFSVFTVHRLACVPKQPKSKQTKKTSVRIRTVFMRLLRQLAFALHLACYSFLHIFAINKWLCFPNYVDRILYISIYENSQTKSRISQRIKGCCWCKMWMLKKIC